jgi:hypothetical protein
MVGATRHQTVAEIERAWEAWVDEPGHFLAYRMRRGDRTTDLRRSDKVVTAYVSGGRWIADCPVCNGGIPAWHVNARGACLDCGTIFRVDHPGLDEIERAETLLAARSDPRTRSWHRHLGETLDDVAAENAALDELDRDRRDRTGGVRLVDVERVLGPDALVKLREAGIE